MGVSLVASAWGKSWASAWGNSWGVIQAAAEIAPSGGLYLYEQQAYLHRQKQEERLKAERIRLGIIEQEKAKLEQEAASVRQEVPKNGTEQDYQNRIYLALLTEQIAALDAENALLLAKLRAIEYEIEQRALEAESAMLAEQDIVFCMAMLAAA